MAAPTKRDEVHELAFLSLLIHEGVSIVEVARQAGHSLTTCSSTYAHVIEEFDPSERVTSEAAIRAARNQLVPLKYPSGAAHAGASTISL